MIKINSSTMEIYISISRYIDFHFFIELNNIF